MAYVRKTSTVEGFAGDEIARRYRLSRLILRDLTPVFKELTPKVGKGIAVNIKTEGSSLGESWKRLSEKYKKQKARDGHRGKMLQRFGKMLNTIEHNPGSRLTKRTLIIGLTGEASKYGGITHYGSPKTGMPARPWMAWSKRMERMALRILEKYVQAVLLGRKSAAKP